MISIDQIAIAFTGAVAVFLTQCRPSLARYACLFGMAGEPAWFYSSGHAHQYGVMTLAVWYTFAWGKGIFVHWIKPWRCAHASK